MQQLYHHRVTSRAMNNRRTGGCVSRKVVVTIIDDAPDHHSVLMAPQTSLVPQHSGPTMHHANPVIAFMIGLSIILIASILNAAGLNLTKLDHVRFCLFSGALLKTS